MVIINPKIINTSGTQTNQEGCLSFPGIRIKVTRPMNLDLEYQDLKGNTCHLSASGLLAQCIDHEYEHLNGQVFIKDLSRLKANLVLRKLKKSANEI
jgi:peptide deformylase